MKRKKLVVATLILLVVGLGALLAAREEADNTYRITATAIEACSCPLFCSCYYNTEPSGGHMCEFNMAQKFAPGSHWGSVDLSDVVVWISGDLGDHFGDGTTEWATITFETSTSPEQREAIGGWLGKMFPVEWASMETREDEITWEDGDSMAKATLGSGLADIQLAKVIDAAGQQAVVHNTAYWAANSTESFLLAHSTHHFDGEDHAFSYEGRNGFMVTTMIEGTLDPE